MWHIARPETHQHALCCQPSNGMAESFLDIFKRDCVSHMDLCDAPTVLAQSPHSFEYFNEI